MLSVGASFPSFQVTAVVDLDLKKAFQPITEKSYVGKWKVYFFWPKDFTFVCPTEIKGFNRSLDEFTKANAVVLAVSVDSRFSHLVWIKSGTRWRIDWTKLRSDVKRW